MNLEISDLFKDIYCPCAKKEKSFSFAAVKHFHKMQITNVAIQDPTT